MATDAIISKIFLQNHADKSFRIVICRNLCHNYLQRC
nr:MAG TPA: hypothetical protein [Caudoviricetes sp.]